MTLYTICIPYEGLYWEYKVFLSRSSAQSKLDELIKENDDFFDYYIQELKLKL